jgi:hypothetical protein
LRDKQDIKNADSLLDIFRDYNIQVSEGENNARGNKRVVSEGLVKKPQRFSKCGHTEFEYDSYWKYYSCISCGWVSEY